MIAYGSTVLWIRTAAITSEFFVIVVAYRIFLLSISRVWTARRFGIWVGLIDDRSPPRKISVMDHPRIRDWRSRANEMAPQGTSDTKINSILVPSRMTVNVQRLAIWIRTPKGSNRSQVVAILAKLGYKAFGLW